ncbi:HAD family hydrolase [Actinomycetospora termitidis]|uniref:HAD-IA family hydrolase n=1 Tax=Actinomycetospora termitidis TaxID=3053470 RepID=A0ABT7M6V0_9PSEU|nr:HAD-IA family hydrolase [Actinomycetospora sp. Odt1-22]MDL5156398.1 HAD-IA family hydrolase [Actinomycetospora sp. Odt1-22]
MTSAILFGSISTVVDTSELQRQAFNRAFAEHGLDWEWDRDEYLSMLQSNGGADRVADYAKQRGEQVDAAAVHATKSTIFQKSLAEGPTEPRPGVLDVVRGAKESGLKLGLVTTTSRDNVRALLDALEPDIRSADFDVVEDTSRVQNVKPDPEAYRTALRELGLEPGDAVAIEDNVGGVQAAKEAGITTVAFPNANTSGHDFGAADTRVDALDLATLRALA